MENNRPAQERDGIELTQAKDSLYSKPWSYCKDSGDPA